MIRNPAIRRVVSLLLVLSFLGLGIFGFVKLASLREPPQARVASEHRLTVDVFQIGPEQIRLTLPGFGTVQADREVVVSAEVAGNVDQVHQDFEVGGAVVAPRYTADENGGAPLVEGDALVVIDEERYRKQVEQVDAQIAELADEEPLVEAELDNAKEVQRPATREFELISTEFARQKDLHKQGVLSKAELDRVELQVQQYQKSKAMADRDVIASKLRLSRTQRQIETLQVQRRLLQDDRNRTVIRPPFDGYLSEVFVEVGQYVKPGEPVARITNIEHVEIPLALTLADYDKLKPRLDRGEQPPVELSLHEDEAPAWTGAVVRISPEADRETRTITVFVEVDNTRQKVPLLPGTFVFARIEGPVYGSDETRVIPRDAILGRRVFRVEDGIAREIPIEIVERLQSVAVVKGGLRPGDRIVLSNLDLLAPGLSVKTSERIHHLADELDPADPWKSYWQILPPANSTVESSPGSAPSTRKETVEVTD